MFNPDNSFKPIRELTKPVEMVPCGCGSGHLIPRYLIVNRCPLLYAKVMVAACSNKHPKKARKA